MITLRDDSFASSMNVYLSTEGSLYFPLYNRSVHTFITYLYNSAEFQARWLAEMVILLFSFLPNWTAGTLLNFKNAN